MPDDEPTPNLAEAAYADARRFAKEGAFAEALERHEWFHEHALTYQPSYYGVRLSFALSAWQDLGTKYPPALEALKRVRDRDAELVRLPGSSDHLFRDVVSINRVLGENAATMNLFREIEHAWPELARSRFRWMSREAFEADGNLFTRYTPDLLAHGRKLLDEHHELMARSVANMPEKILADPKFDGIQERLRQRFAGELRASIQRLAALAASSGQLEVSKSILGLIEDSESTEHGLTA